MSQVLNPTGLPHVPESVPAQRGYEDPPRPTSPDLPDLVRGQLPNGHQPTTLGIEH